MDTKVRAKPSLRRVGFHVRIACAFVLLIAAIIGASLLGVRGQIPMSLVAAVIVFTAGLTWLAVWREWQTVHRLARVVGSWGVTLPGRDALNLDFLSRPMDPDVAALAGSVHSLAVRALNNAQREHQFTRDVSHELRNPLTVVKMSADRLLDSPRLPVADLRTVRNIRQASLELEAMVEALLVLAREPDERTGGEHFVANDVVHAEISAVREFLADRPVELRYEESARFALEGSARGFAVLCGQLIRNAYQQTDEGSIEIRLSPQMLSVSNSIVLPVAVATRSHQARAASRHGFELGVARRISDRFAWPLDLESGGNEPRNIARISFARWFPPEVADAPLAVRQT